MKKLFIAALLFMPAISQAGDSFTGWVSREYRMNDNTPICSMFNSIQRGVNVSNIAIKTSRSYEGLLMTIYKDTWSVPDGIYIPVEVSFPQHMSFDATGYGDGKMVNIPIPPDMVGDVFNLMMLSESLNISFPEGDEDLWRIPLENARQPLIDFSHCILDRDETQPY